MGLDMYLCAKRHMSGFIKDSDKALIAGVGALFPDIDYTPTNVEFEVAYWRKANQIHSWFVRNVQGGVDDCGSYAVSKKKLQDLYDLVKLVYESKNPELARNMLEPREGFFFGSTDIDEGYWRDLDETLKMLEPFLDENKFDYPWSFTYSSSW